MKYLIPVCLLSLAACAPTPQEKERAREGDMLLVQSKLPEECKLNYAGEIRVDQDWNPSRIFYVKCDNTVTTNESHQVQVGKTQRTESNIVVQQ